MAIEEVAPEVEGSSGNIRSEREDALMECGVMDYKNVGLLLKAVSEGARIIPSRLTNRPFKVQRKKRIAILRARFLALIPFVRK